jgi:hypothetical protein
MDTVEPLSDGNLSNGNSSDTPLEPPVPKLIPLDTYLQIRRLLFATDDESPLWLCLILHHELSDISLHTPYASFPRNMSHLEARLLEF